MLPDPRIEKINHILDKITSFGCETMQYKTFTEEIQQAREAALILGNLAEDAMTKPAGNSV